MEDNFNKNLDSYFTTGEFAKLCKVKKQTLFHYDDIGIFATCWFSVLVTIEL